MSDTSDKTRSNVGLPRTYEELLDQSPQESIYANTWWLDAVAPNSYEVIELRNNEGLLAAWPVVYKQDIESRHVVMPGLTQKLGIVFSRSDGKSVEIQSRNQHRCEELIHRVENCASFTQNFHEAFTDWLPFYWRGYKQTTRYTYVIDDLSDIDTVWEGLRPHHRKAIRKAEKYQLKIDHSMELDAFLELNRLTFQRQGIEPPIPNDFIQRLDSAICKNATRMIFSCVDSQGRVHGAAYLIFSRRTAYYLMGAGDPELRDSGGQLLALWEAIRWAQQVAQRFDFEGSMLESVESVFRGFGAKQYPYFAISKGITDPVSLKAAFKLAIQLRVQRFKSRIWSKRS